MDSAEICAWTLLLNVFANDVKKKVSDGVTNNADDGRLPRMVKLRASNSDQMNGVWTTINKIEEGFSAWE